MLTNRRRRSKCRVQNGLGTLEIRRSLLGSIKMWEVQIRAVEEEIELNEAKSRHVLDKRTSSRDKMENMLILDKNAQKVWF